MTDKQWQGQRYNKEGEKAELVPQKSFAGWSSTDIDISNGIVPKEMKNFLDFVSESLNIPISIVSLGPGRDETIIF